MKIPLFSLLLMFIEIPLMTNSNWCSIIMSMNCSCFQSNDNLDLSQSYPIYSHLHCNGNYSEQKSFQLILGSDVKYQNHFRTISLEFSLNDQFEIRSNQFDFLSLLSSESNVDEPIQISIRFNHFYQLKFQSKSFTSKVFPQKHRQKSLKLIFVPSSTINRTQIVSNSERKKTKDEEEIQFSSNSFFGLNVSQLDVSIHSREDNFISSKAFESIFNHTNIGQMHFYGCLLAQSISSLKETFQGKIHSLTIHRRIDTIDSKTFPFYSSVQSYEIHSIDSHSMNLTSFVSPYDNLHGIEIINPRFEVFFDEYLPQLKSLKLDVEHLNEKTFYRATHIQHLKLGSRLRRIDPHVFYLFPNQLKDLDLSQIDLLEMTPDSRCYLINYLSHYSSSQWTLIYPRLEFRRECQCAPLYLHYLRFSSTISLDSYQEDFCSKQCRFSDCHTISDYFRKKFPLITNSNSMVSSSNITNDIFPSVDLYPDQTDVDLIDFLHHQEEEEETVRPTSKEIPTERKLFAFPSTTIKMNKSVSKDNLKSQVFKPIPIDSYPTEDRSSKSSEENESNANLFLICMSILVILIILGCILSFLLIKCPCHRRRHFKPVPVHI